MVSLKRPIHLALVALSLFGISFVQAATEADIQFDEGMRAFQAGDYVTAQAQFEALREAGLRSVSLDYNLGVSYYKLQQYTAAERAFKRVSEHKPMRAVGYYNIARVYTQLGATDTAQYWYQLAYENNDTEISKLARIQLDEISATPREPWWVSFGASMGFDDNLIDQSTGISITESSTFNELQYGLRGLLSGTEEYGVSLEINAYIVNYSDIDLYDYKLVQTSIKGLEKRGDWSIGAGIFIDQGHLGDTAYTQNSGLELIGRKRLGNQEKLDLRYRVSNINALDQLYEHLDGSQHQLEVVTRFPLRQVKWKLFYRFELNDRNDFKSGPVFTSYSPMRHEFQLSAIKSLSDNWKAGIEYGYRLSRYDDENKLSPGVHVLRDDTMYQLSMNAIKSIDEHWDLVLEYQYTNNSSNIDIFDYDRNRYQLSLFALF